MVKQNLSKTCVACELQKPLNAFLQISGPQGSTYGNVCSTCRGSGAGKTVVIPDLDEEESSSSSSGLKIDAKMKLQQERDINEQVKLKSESQEDEKKKDAFEDTSLLERKEDRLQAEKKHRVDIETKKNSFLNYKSKAPQTSIETKTIESEKAALASGIITETQHKDAAIKQDEKARTIGLGDGGESFTDTATGEVKYQSAEFLKVKSWLGRSAAITTFERQHLASGNSPPASPAPIQAQPTVSSPTGEKAQPDAPAPPASSHSFSPIFSSARKVTDPLVKFVQENLEPTPTKPGSRRGG